MLHPWVARELAVAHVRTLRDDGGGFRRRPARRRRRWRTALGGLLVEAGHRLARTA